jgi:hypothetical protein
MLVGTVGVLVALSVDTPVGVGALIGAPALAGFAVCGLGGTSKFYQGSCAPAVGGALVGALTSIPFTLLGCWVYDDSRDHLGCTSGAILGFLLGYCVGTAAGATIGWHLGKSPRAADFAGRAGRPWATWRPGPEPRRPSDRGHQGLRVSVPLLAFEF